MIRVRVRGIYATALSHIFLKNNYTIVQASDIIVQRLKIAFDPSPPHVTVKDGEDDSILVMGKPEESRIVFDRLISHLKYVFKLNPRVNLHSVYVGRVERVEPSYCIVNLGEFKGVLKDCRGLRENDKVVVGVSKTAFTNNEQIELTRNFRVTGEYASLIHGSPRISFSEHIRDSGLRTRLSALAVSKLVGSGLGVKFRSSARFASPSEIELEIDALLKEYRTLIEQANNRVDPGMLRDGDFIGIVYLTSLAKKILDRERRSVTPTVQMHHELKSIGLDRELDLAEIIIEKGCKDATIGQGLKEWVVKKIREERKIRLLHCSISKGYRELTPGIIRFLKLENGRIQMMVERVFRSRGTYDGLGSERLPGDLDLLIIKEGSYVLSHNYFRREKWLGSYININTPPEIAPGIVKYHDLEVDVVVRPGEQPQVLDLEKLNHLYQQGVITPELHELSRKIVEHVVNNTNSYICTEFNRAESCIE
ncbi:MAG: DUF402 domain-containing protein [Thermosphaera sp.]